MALSNAERQARHRERIKEKLRNAAPSEPLRNDLLEEMRAAFNEAHASAVREAIEQIDQRPLVAGESDWFRMRELLLSAPDGFIKDEEFFIALARESGAKLGNYLTMSIYRDFLAEEVKQSSTPERVSRRKRVT